MKIKCLEANASELDILSNVSNDIIVLIDSTNLKKYKSNRYQTFIWNNKIAAVPKIMDKSKIRERQKEYKYILNSMFELSNNIDLQRCADNYIYKTNNVRVLHRVRDNLLVQSKYKEIISYIYKRKNKDITETTKLKHHLDGIHFYVTKDNRTNNNIIVIKKSSQIKEINLELGDIENIISHLGLDIKDTTIITDYVIELKDIFKNKIKNDIFSIHTNNNNNSLLSYIYLGIFKTNLSVYKNDIIRKSGKIYTEKDNQLAMTCNASVDNNRALLDIVLLDSRLSKVKAVIEIMRYIEELNVDIAYLKFSNRSLIMSPPMAIKNKLIRIKDGLYVYVKKQEYIEAALDNHTIYLNEDSSIKIWKGELPAIYDIFKGEVIEDVNN